MNKKNQIVFAEDEQILEDLKDWAKVMAKYRKPDSRKAFTQLSTSILPFIAIWIVMYLLSGNFYLLLLFALFNAFFLARIFIIQHDCGHKSYFSNRRMNIITGWVCSLFTFMPYSYWAALHQFHHVHSSELEDRDIGDINMLTVEEYSQLSITGKLKYRIYRSILVLFILGPLYYIIIHLRIPVIRFKCSRIARIEALITNASYIVFYGALCLLLGWEKVLLIHGLIMIFFSIMAVWFFYVQHQHNPNYKQTRDKRDYLLAAIKGSTYYKLPKLFMWLSGNIGYHHIHHLFPAIPNYHLEKCMIENPNLQTHVTQVGFWKSLSYIRHKLWDEEQNKMITFREFKNKYKNIYSVTDKSIMGSALK
jgi:acyl-lipid omega-6 desaturase (Delta-12 desaturase)